MARSVLIFLINGLGGAEKVSLDISRFLHDDGWEVNYAVVGVEDGINPQLTPRFLPGARVEFIKWKSQFSLLKNLRKTIRDVKPDVVFSSAMHINQRLLLLSPLFPKIKFIVRNDNYLYTLPKLKKTTLRLTYPLADAIISQTEEMEEELVAIGLSQRMIHTLHNPVHLEYILKQAAEEAPFPDDGRTRFVAVGRTARQKGFDILIEAFFKVQTRLPDSELYIVGNTDYMGGENYRALKKRINELGIEQKVHFTGFQHNPYKYIRNSDVFVLSSRYEGLPNVLIESQFLGVPAAAFTCIPIISRIIDEGKSGFMATPGDPDSLAEAMLRATQLSQFKPVYTPAAPSDFVKLFDSLIKQA